MEPIINLGETPGKTVGKRLTPPDGLALTDAQRAESAIAWQRALGGLKVARGVYRFHTHEDAEAWLWEKMTNAQR